MTELPEHLLISDILLRLPLKSIGRFRCVSKQWRSWLSSHQFINALIPDSPGISIIMELETNWVTSFYTSTIRDSNNLVMKNLTYPLTEEHGCASMDGSCRGLVLLSHYKKNGDRSSKVLMNPVTREAEEVVNYTSSKFAWHCGLGYDSLSDDYKVVTLTHEPDGNSSRVDIYSVKAKTWKTVGDSKYTFLSPIIGRTFIDQSGVFVNGCVHWKVYEPDNAIAAFSLAREEFEILPPPTALDQTDFNWTDLVILEGCITLVLHNPGSRWVDVWMKKEFGVEGSWMKVTIPCPRPQDVRMKPVSVVCLLGDDDILVRYDTEQLMVYNCTSGDWKDVDVAGTPPKPTIIGSCTTYTQTLASLSYNRLESGNTQEYIL